MAGWHHWLDGRESEWTPGVGDGQGGLACCDSWGRKESDTTERLNWTELWLLWIINASIQVSVWVIAFNCGCSVTKSCLTPCDPMNCSMLGFPVLHYVWVCSDSRPLSQWCHPTISSSVLPLLLTSIFPSIRVFSNESVLPIRWPKFWGFSFSISPSNEYSGLISCRLDWCDLLAVQGILKSLFQHHISKAPVLQCSGFFMVQLSYLYMTTGKNIALTIQTFACKMMSLLFNKLSRFVIAFLQRRKRIWNSWLQSLSAVNLKPKKIKSVTISTFAPPICHEVMGLDAMLFVCWMLSFKLAFTSLHFHSHQEAVFTFLH